MGWRRAWKGQPNIKAVIRHRGEGGAQGRGLLGCLAFGFFGTLDDDRPFSTRTQGERPENQRTFVCWRAWTIEDAPVSKAASVRSVSARLPKRGRRQTGSPRVCPRSIAGHAATRRNVTSRRPVRSDRITGPAARDAGPGGLRPVRGRPAWRPARLDRRARAAVVASPPRPGLQSDPH